MERAVGAVRLLAAATPTNAVAERARLIAAAERDRPLVPTWTYAPPRRTDVRPVLDAIREALAELGAEPLAGIYRARVDELALEAEIVAAVGTPALAAKAAARFAPFAESTRRAGIALRDDWARAYARGEDDDPAEIPTDSSDPNSLLSILEREVGARGLPFCVRVHPALASLAATGDGILLVAAGRAITKRAAVRTALHEIEGHALPRLRAAERGLGIFRLGTARGVDEQEGFALVVEHRAGLLRGARCRDLAARASAVEAMRSGADFGAVVRLLDREHDLGSTDAVRVAERVFRGSDGTFAGLGRESVYLESFVRVRDLLEKQPEREHVLTSGQVSVDAAAVLARYV